MWELFLAKEPYLSGPIAKVKFGSAVSDQATNVLLYSGNITNNGYTVVEKEIDIKMGKEEASEFTFTDYSSSEVSLGAQVELTYMRPLVKAGFGKPKVKDDTNETGNTEGTGNASNSGNASSSNTSNSFYVEVILSGYGSYTTYDETTRTLSIKSNRQYGFNSKLTVPTFTTLYYNCYINFLDNILTDFVVEREIKAKLNDSNFTGKEIKQYLKSLDPKVEDYITEIKNDSVFLKSKGQFKGSVSLNNYVFVSLVNPPLTICYIGIADMFLTYDPAHNKLMFSKIKSHHSEWVIIPDSGFYKIENVSAKKFLSIKSNQLICVDYSIADNYQLWLVPTESGTIRNSQFIFQNKCITMYEKSEEYTVNGKKVTGTIHLPSIEIINLSDSSNQTFKLTGI